MQNSPYSHGPRGISGTVRVSLTQSGPIVEAQYSARPHPLLIEAHAFGRLVRAYLAEGAVARSLLRPGTPLLLAPRDEPSRKPAYQVVAVERHGEWVSLDDQLAVRLVETALGQAALPQFARYAKISRDITFGSRKIAFRLGEGPLECLLEVRGTTRVEEQVARYPESEPDLRLNAQLDLMTSIARNGRRAALIFVIQRGQSNAFVPADDVDEAFSRAFRAARASGVEFYAYRCPIAPTGMTLGDEVPVYATREAIPTSRWEA